MEVAQSIYLSKAEKVVAAQLPEEVVPNLLALMVKEVVVVLELLQWGKVAVVQAPRFGYRLEKS